VDPADFSTVALFGDAASATIVLGGDRIGDAALIARRPVLGSAPDAGRALRHGEGATGPVEMDGPRVFAHAVTGMADALNAACADAGVRPPELDWVAPHQANGRILDALSGRLGLPRDRVLRHLRDVGNTSSSSIPLTLAAHRPWREPGSRGALVAFGAGFTNGAVIVSSPTLEGMPR
jgi:3-oxoacyl-[acyl-carrier-protein] synthase III